MDKVYADTVRLLLSVAPDVFAGGVFALKGGTAINLFVRDMPRLSVDIDAVYTRRQDDRKTALVAIGNELNAVAKRLRNRNFTTRLVSANNLGDSKLFIEDGNIQVKVEVNTVFRGTVHPVERRALAASAAERFSVELELPMLAVDELYGGKLVAALDRQHPRDLFDVMQMYEAGGLTEGMVECFVIYLAGHNRPLHEVLFANPKNITHEFDASFKGMTVEQVEVDSLVKARDWIIRDLTERLTDNHRGFLLGLARARPDWSLLQCQHAAELPALRWKLQNLQTLRRMNPSKFENQVRTLEERLA